MRISATLSNALRTENRSAIMCAKTGSSRQNRTGHDHDRNCPDIDAGEITDKGHLNQRKIIARRTSLIETLYSSEAPHEQVMLFAN